MLILGNRSASHSPTKASSGQSSISRPDLEDKLIPNARGHISVCYFRNMEDPNVTEEVK